MMRTFLILACTAGCSSQGAAPPGDGGMDTSLPSDGSMSDRVYSQDGSICTPKDLTGFLPPAFTPPVPTQNVCTPAQIQAFYANCVGDQSTIPGCQLWSANNKSCNACVATADSATAWGALVYAADGYRTNPSGCIATLGFLDCAKREDALWACTDAACHENCPPDPDGGSDSYEACRTAAASSVCKVYKAEVDAACPMDGASIALCLQSDLQKFYMAFAPILCSSGG